MSSTTFKNLKDMVTRNNQFSILNTYNLLLNKLVHTKCQACFDKLFFMLPT